ncbi:MAG: menaquinone biosynthesis decarboxylase [Bacteroidetes bacterium HGW-Bacteroidetes-21]|nr:MAG: menaquinone biosynthesis decarboxylase [Bacteroidetes bacterium HGW-Bacteroidetes-21]
MSGIADFIQILKKENELLEITQRVSPDLEITEITDRISKQSGGGKALLFTNNGTKFPLLINALGSEKRMLKALQLNTYSEFGDRVQMILSTLMKNAGSGFAGKWSALLTLKEVSGYFPKYKKRRGACQEVVDMSPDLENLPILKCWPYDAGKFITLPMVHTKDPVTGILNVGMYRMQVMSKNTTGMHWHMHKTGARHYNEYKERGLRIPIAVALGGDPMYAWCASAPLPEQISEYVLAGFLRKKPVKLVKCLSQDIEVPEDADIVIEGYVDPSEPLVTEGPFGDHTGFYSLADKYPVFHVTCITHRKNAVYPATIVGIPPQEDYYYIQATERLFLPLLQLTQLPEIMNMHMPPAGVAHNLVVISIKKGFPGHVQKIMHAMWGAGQMMFNKVLVVVDHDVDVRNYNQIMKVIATCADPRTDLMFSSGASDVLDHAADSFAFSGKIGIDATRKENKLENILHISVELKEIQINKYFIDNAFPVFFVNEAIAFDYQKYIPLIERGSAILIVVDFNPDKLCSEYLLWYVLANMDPLRDVYKVVQENKLIWIINAMSGKNKSDGSRWPNITSMDEATINEIDNRWNDIMSLPMIDSPSRIYTFISGSGAEK